MCKSHIETEFNQFLAEFQNLKTAYFDFIKENILSKKKTIKMCILSNLMEHIQNENSFALYDENIFEIYKSIVESYKVFLCQYENTQLKLNSEIRKNLQGVVAVLSSQISFFEENDTLGINPITVEKKGIIANYLDKIYEDIEKFLEISFEELFGNFQNIDKEQTKDIFVKYIKEKIITSYEENMKSCFNNINDNQNREIISYYNDVLEEEKEILSSIIKVQINALEELCKDDYEKQILEKLLIPLREIYQHSKKQFDIHTENIKNINAFLNINIEKDIQNIFKILDEILNIAYKVEGNINDDITQKFQNIVSQYLKYKYIEKNHTIDILNKEILDTKELLQDITNSFDTVGIFTKQNLEKYNNTEFKEIIYGIYESINIKVETLNENKEQFFSQFLEIEDVIKIQEKFDIEQIEYNSQELFEYSIKQDFENFCKYVDKNIFDKSLNKISTLIEKFYKIIYNLKKDVILFEITTFEEILNYSIARLRNSDDIFISELISEIDTTTENIKNILYDKNIFQINPKPHTIFDAKEHEILMAEKDEQFKKGEIIKVLNCGYKIFDKVIIRANVIAAK